MARRLLLTNDDGIDSVGLTALLETAQEICEDVWVVAPLHEQSGTSHALTLHQPLRLLQRDDKIYAIDGTPSDAVFVALRHLLHDHPPDLVLSGFNLGANAGTDVIYSGTVAAAMEAALVNIPSIALSQWMKDDLSFDFTMAQKILPDIIKKAEQLSFDDNLLLNVNFPACRHDELKGFKICPQGRTHRSADVHESLDPRGMPYFWIGTPHNEDPHKEQCERRDIRDNFITITPLRPDWTCAQTLEKLRTHF